MKDSPADVGWLDLVRPARLPTLAVLLGGILLHSMNVLLVATVLPSIVNEIGGASLMSWPTTAYLASSIVAATCTAPLTAAIGARGQVRLLLDKRVGDAVTVAPTTGAVCSA